MDLALHVFALQPARALAALRVAYPKLCLADPKDLLARRFMTTSLRKLIKTIASPGTGPLVLVYGPDGDPEGVGSLLTDDARPYENMALCFDTDAWPQMEGGGVGVDFRDQGFSQVHRQPGDSYETFVLRVRTG